MPYAARLAPRRFGTMGESSAELVAPATDRFVCDHDTTLKQQLLDVAKAQAEPEIPANRAADDDGREAVTVIKRFRFLHHFILPPPPRQADRAVCVTTLPYSHPCSNARQDSRCRQGLRHAKLRRTLPRAASRRT